MRKTTFVPVLAAALVALPMAVQAQQPAPRTQAEAARGARGMPMLQRFAEELNLTTQQQTQLQAIRERLQARNAPLVAQLREAGVAGREAKRDSTRAQMTPDRRQQMRERMQNATPEQREQMRERMRERRQAAGQAGPRERREMPAHLRPVMQQLRENSRAAAEEMRAVLTPEQQTRLRSLMQERRQQHGEHLRRGARGERGTR